LQRIYAGQDVRFLSITCDPDNDTPQALTKYADMFNADRDSWLFLTGDMEYTEQVGHNFFGVPVAKQGHTEKFVVVDRSGTVRGYYHWAKPAEFAKLQALIDELLDEPIVVSPAEQAAEDVAVKDETGNQSTDEVPADAVDDPQPADAPQREEEPLNAGKESL
jgi:protein SCO1